MLQPSGERYGFYQQVILGRSILNTTDALRYVLIHNSIIQHSRVMCHGMSVYTGTVIDTTQPSRSVQVLTSSQALQTSPTMRSIITRVLSRNSLPPSKRTEPKLYTKIVSPFQKKVCSFHTTTTSQSQTAAQL